MTQPSAPNPVQAPRPARRAALPLILAVIAAFLVGGFVGFGLGRGNTSTPRAGGQAGIAVGEEPDPQAAQPSPEADATPRPADFVLSPKVVKKQCFGSAGCNVDFKVDVTYTGPKLSDSDTWDVTYSVSGSDDGPLVDQIQLTGTQYTASTQSVSTANNSTKLKIKVTDIAKE